MLITSLSAPPPHPEIKAEIRAVRESLTRIENHVERLDENMLKLSLDVSTRVVRLETQMKIVLGIVGASGLGAAGFFGLGG